MTALIYPMMTSAIKKATTKPSLRRLRSLAVMVGSNSSMSSGLLF